MKYKYILFDLDGTLTDPFEGITTCFKYALDYYGISAEQKDLTCVIGPPLIDSFCKFFDFDEEEGWRAVAKYRERFETIGWQENRLLDGVPEMLADLKADNRILTLATSKPIVYARKIIEMFDIAKYFDYAIGAEIGGKKGTKPEIVEKALKTICIPDKESVIMVGDRENDVEGAKAFGISSLGVRCGYAAPGELERAGADFIADTVGDMRDFLMNADAASLSK